MIIPQVTLAAWWNPLSWNIFSFLFQNNSQVQQVQIESTTTLTSQSIPETSINTSVTTATTTVESTPAAVSRPQKKIHTVTTTSVPATSPVQTQVYVAPVTTSSQSCDSGYTLDKDTNKCVTPLAYCQNHDGVNATYDSTNNSCGCATGYAFNSSNVCAAKESGYQFCSEQYSNATWDGTSYTSSGGFNCECKSGYTATNNNGAQSCQPLGNPYQAQDGNCYYPNAYDSNGKPLQAQCPANIVQQQQRATSPSVNLACQTATNNMEKFQNAYANNQNPGGGAAANIAQAKAAIFANQYNTELPAYQTAAQAACSVPLPIPAICQTALQDFDTFQAQNPISQLAWMGVQGDSIALRFPAHQTDIQYACQ